LASFGAFLTTTRLELRLAVSMRGEPGGSAPRQLRADLCHRAIPQHLRDPHIRQIYRFSSHTPRAALPLLRRAGLHLSANPHELQDPILCFRTLPSATASSRGVGEPGTGAKVVKDHNEPTKS
jgi:hypothetical protein